MTDTLSTAAATSEPVPFIDLRAQHQTIKSEIAEAVERVFESQAFVLGDEVSEFECDVAEYCDSRDAIVALLTNVFSNEVALETTTKVRFYCAC